MVILLQNNNIKIKLFGNQVFCNKQKGTCFILQEDFRRLNLFVSNHLTNDGSKKKKKNGFSFMKYISSLSCEAICKKIIFHFHTLSL